MMYLYPVICVIGFAQFDGHAIPRWIRESKLKGVQVDVNLLPVQLEIKVCRFTCVVQGLTCS